MGSPLFLFLFFFALSRQQTTKAWPRKGEGDLKRSSRLTPRIDYSSLSVKGEVGWWGCFVVPTNYASCFACCYYYYYYLWCRVRYDNDTLFSLPTQTRTQTNIHYTVCPQPSLLATQICSVSSLPFVSPLFVPFVLHLSSSSLSLQLLFLMMVRVKKEGHCCNYQHSKNTEEKGKKWRRNCTDTLLMT